jgi:RNA polymerase sigma-70 factor (ECF subfamily)
VLEAARRGEGWAFTRLFEVVAQPLVGYFRAHHAWDPDGLANEVLVRAFTQIERFSGDEKGFRSWVFAIAHCRLIDSKRAAARRPVCGGEVDAETLVGGDVEQDAAIVLGSSWVDEILAELAPDQREVLVLRFVSDLSLDETARVLEKSTGAVKALQHRALRAIRRRLSFDENELSALVV